MRDTIDLGSAEPRVSVLALIGPGEEESAPELVEGVRSQRGVLAELVIVDRTKHGGLVVEGARVVRCDSPSRGRAWRCGLDESHGEYVAWLRPGCRLIPARLAHAVAALEAEDRPDIVTCDYFLHDDDGQPVGRSHPGGMGEVPGPFWESGVVMRREVLATIGETAFHPIELELWQRLRAAGRAAHVTEPGFSVHRGRYDSAWERSRHDGALLALAERPITGERPELTVSICAFERKDVLLECLEAFSRQLLAPGTFEIVLVIDGSTDGTIEPLGSLEFPVPVRVLHREHDGLAAARNTGLEVARGRLVLFVDDDTIPLPDCVERHIRTHAELGPKEQVAVVGSFEQPREALGNALPRYLEQSTEVFSFPATKPREFHDGFHFSTCNVSVPLDAVRRAGGFDPSFNDCGLEDIDLGLRLEGLGTRVYHEPAARALHRRLLDFETLRRRQHTAARAYVRLFRKHPEALARWGDRTLTAEQCHRLGGRSGVQSGVRSGGELSRLERAARELARIDVGALEALGGTYQDTALEVLASLGELLRGLGCAWALQGYLEGFREHGIAGFHELLAAGEGPHPIHSDAQRKLLAWPRWDDPESLDRLMEWAEAGAVGGFAALVLRRDPERDPACADATAALEAAYGRRFAMDVELEIVLEDRPLDRSELLRLGRSVDALLLLGDEPREFLATIGAERLRTPAEVAEWRRRFGSAESAAAEECAGASDAPELSVIVPTRDRPRELAQLLDCLARQDLAAARFEVLVIDDGSDQPASSVLTDRDPPFALEFLRQEPAGPGAARNLGLARARGEIVVFFNDDAVPASDNLRQHLAAHRQRTGTHAVLGTFTLLPELVTDSFTHHVETSTALFAQPTMAPGVLYHGLAFSTGNVSIPRRCLEAVGGFDESFRYAGGEDSELGLRLERQLGVRVLFDPTVRCGHDHALDIRGFLQRQRVIGWAAYRIEAKHGDTGLVPERLLDEAAWDELRRDALAAAPALTRLVETVFETCRHEREGQWGPAALARLRGAFECIREFGCNCGLLAAHAGRPPDEYEPVPEIVAAGQAT